MSTARCHDYVTAAASRKIRRTAVPVSSMHRTASLHPSAGIRDRYADTFEPSIKQESPPYMLFVLFLALHRVTV